MKLPRESSPYEAPRDFGPHRGRDFAIPVGTPIRTSASGMSWGADESRGYGYHVRTRTSDGEVHISAHHTKLLIPTGEGNAVWTPRGTLVAYSGGAKGSVGSGSSTGPHTHLEVRTPAYRRGMSRSDSRGWRRMTDEEALIVFNPSQEDEMTNEQMNEIKEFIQTEVRQGVRVGVAATLFGYNADDKGSWLRDDASPWTKDLPNLREIKALVERTSNGGVDIEALSTMIVDKVAARLNRK